MLLAVGGAAYGAVKLSQKDADRIEEYSGSSVEEMTEEELVALKDIVFGSCTGCRRCTVNCPFGVDTAILVGLARSCLVDEEIAPEGVLTVMKDQWETGNQMAVTKEDYLETLEWIEEELQDEFADPNFKVPIDKKGADFVFVVNPREIK